MIRKAILLTAIIMMAIIALQCKHETDFSDFPANPEPPIPTASCDPDTAYFVNSVLPLLQSSCARSGCHDAGSASHGVIMTDYFRIKITGDVKPGNASGSKLYKVLSASGESKMPPSPNDGFTAEQKALIAKWINQGAKNNYCTEACNPELFTFAADIFPIIETNCKGCHSGSQPNGGVRLEDYASVKISATNGSLYGSVSHDAGYSPMPKDGNKLSTCNLSQIKNWIDNGAPNN